MVLQDQYVVMVGKSQQPGYYEAVYLSGSHNAFVLSCHNTEIINGYVMTSGVVIIVI